MFVPGKRRLETWLKNVIVNVNGRASYWNNKILILLNDFVAIRNNSYENNLDRKFRKTGDIITIRRVRQNYYLPLIYKETNPKKKAPKQKSLRINNWVCDHALNCCDILQPMMIERYHDYWLIFINTQTLLKYIYMCVYIYTWIYIVLCYIYFIIYD